MSNAQRSKRPNMTPKRLLMAAPIFAGIVWAIHGGHNFYIQTAIIFMFGTVAVFWFKGHIRPFSENELGMYGTASVLAGLVAEYLLPRNTFVEGALYLLPAVAGLALLVAWYKVRKT